MEGDGGRDGFKEGGEARRRAASDSLSYFFFKQQIKRNLRPPPTKAKVQEDTKSENDLCTDSSSFTGEAALI